MEMCIRDSPCTELIGRFLYAMPVLADKDKLSITGDGDEMCIRDSSIAKQAWDLFLTVEEDGGFYASVKAGKVQAAVNESNKASRQNSFHQESGFTIDIGQ